MKTITIGKLTIRIDATAYVKWQNRARKMGKTIQEVIAEALKV